jgi:hypothetical protein
MPLTGNSHRQQSPAAGPLPRHAAVAVPDRAGLGPDLPAVGPCGWKISFGHPQFLRRPTTH